MISKFGDAWDRRIITVNNRKEMSKEEQEKQLQYWETVRELVDGKSLPRLKLKNIKDVAMTAISELENAND